MKNVILGRTFPRSGKSAVYEGRSLQDDILRVYSLE